MSPNPIRVFYDDLYLYQEFSQPVEGQAAPVVFKIATGARPEYAELAAHIEKVFAEAYAPQGGGSADNPADAEQAAAAAFAAAFSSGAKPAGLPAEHYAEHTLFVTGMGTVWHLEYHDFPEPILYVLVEPLKSARRETFLSTQAILYDQEYEVNGQDYLVTSLRGNYADFPSYSPFWLDKEVPGLLVFDCGALLKLGAVFRKAERGEGNRLDAEPFFRRAVAPLFLASLFLNSAR